jgi:Domain of unknown function (DUF4385)
MKIRVDPTIDYRAQPERYLIGRGEEGVLRVQPYKSEILPLWRFATPEQARTSSRAIFEKYQEYKANNDFVGMDMARKYLQMGWTRARRYANHKTGKKYDGPVPLERRGQSGAWGRAQLPIDPDPVKAESAAIFFELYQQVLNDPDYQTRKRAHLEQFERPGNGVLKSDQSGTNARLDASAPGKPAQ